MKPGPRSRNVVRALEGNPLNDLLEDIRPDAGARPSDVA